MPINQIVVRELFRERFGEESGSISYFNEMDRKHVVSKRLQQQWRRVFKRVPWTFNIVFDGRELGMKGSVWDIDPPCTASDEYVRRAAICKDMGLWIKDNVHSERSISVCLTNNTTPQNNYMPFTPWIIAHRIGHALTIEQYIRDEIIGGNEAARQPYRCLMSIDDIVPSRRKMPNRTSRAILHDITTAATTYRSARIKKVSESGLEHSAEMIAQMIICGKITFTTAEDFLVRYYDGDVDLEAFDLTELDRSLRQCEAEINQLFRKIIDDGVGKVLMF